MKQRRPAVDPVKLELTTAQLETMSSRQLDRLQHVLDQISASGSGPSMSLDDLLAVIAKAIKGPEAPSPVEDGSAYAEAIGDFSFTPTPPSSRSFVRETSRASSFTKGRVDHGPLSTSTTDPEEFVDELPERRRRRRRRPLSEPSSAVSDGSEDDERNDDRSPSVRPRRTRRFASTDVSLEERRRMVSPFHSQSQFVSTRDDQQHW